MSRRAPLVIANWKMNMTVDMAVDFVKVLQLEKILTEREAWIAPPFTAIYAMSKLIATGIRLGGQNINSHACGAHTGEISGKLLKDAGASFVIVGHSERRMLCGETNEKVRKKLERCTIEQLIPVLCIGEDEREMKGEKTEQVLRLQLTSSLAHFEAEELSDLIISYEPIWAIGTGIAATPEHAQKVHELIRKIISEIHGQEFANKLRILYGGSVKPSNIGALMQQKDIDGVLVGGASLDVKQYIEMINYKD